MIFSVSSRTSVVRHLLPVATVLILSSGQALAAGITIGANSSISVGAGMINVGCGDLTNNGTLDLGSGTVDNTFDVSNSGLIDDGGNSGLLQFGGSWLNAGTVAPGMTTIAVVDECGTDPITFGGSADFYNLSMTTTAGKTVVLDSGATQSVAGALTFNGSTNNYLVLEASSPGSPTFTELDGGGSQSISWVDVADNFAFQPFQYIAPNIPEAFDSIDQGSNFRWFIEPRKVIAVPTMSRLGTVLLVALMLFGAATARRRMI
jgi:hypothetical protein